MDIITKVKFPTIAQATHDNVLHVTKEVNHGSV